jgi:hypothetical protein
VVLIAGVVLALLAWMRVMLLLVQELARSASAWILPPGP